MAIRFARMRSIYGKYKTKTSSSKSSCASTIWSRRFGKSVQPLLHITASQCDPGWWQRLCNPPGVRCILEILHPRRYPARCVDSFGRHRSENAEGDHLSSTHGADPSATGVLTIGRCLRHKCTDSKKICTFCIKSRFSKPVICMLI